MAKLKVDDLIKGLKYVEANRRTFYSNQFPYNCGYIHANGQQSYDCIGLVKCPINEPDIFYKTAPVGYYVKPAKVIPDTTELGLLNLCTEVSYDFSKIAKGEYLYMNGHGAWYVGEFSDASGVVNVIECTPAFGGGVVTSYVDAYGFRWNHKGGYQAGKWEAHGKLSKYIEYEPEKNYIWKHEWHLYDGDKELTGWQKVNNKWYYMNDKGVMQTGWLKDKGKWYFLEESGAMKTGWLLDKGKWYYLNPQNGEMFTGTHVIDGKSYTFDSSGALIS